MKLVYQKNEIKLSVVAASIVFLALIRTIAEPFRLNYLRINFDYYTLKPLLAGALVASAALFIIALFSLYQKYSFIIITSIVTVILLMIIKPLM